MQTAESRFLPRPRLDALFAALAAEGWRVVGPRVREGAIVHDTVEGPEDLPRGLRDRQAPGEYRLEAADDELCFAWANGPQAVKPLLFRPTELLWRMRRADDGGLHFEPAEPEAEPVAVLGARACDLAALALQDRHFIECDYPDPAYTARRERLLLIAVDCSHPADTCFCVSTGDGPSADAGFDLALRELADGFLVRTCSERGRRIADALPLEAASEAQQAAARQQHETACAAQTRALPSRDLQAALFDNLEHPRWDDVAARCLACGNCTSVCPTCFCHAEADRPALGGRDSEHHREWDSCFTQRHAEMHGYKVRPHIRQRYRQWLTHKLGSWHAQYGRSGCTGCGRCITWCPVGIDIVTEATAVCAGEPQP